MKVKYILGLISLAIVLSGCFAFQTDKHLKLKKEKSLFVAKSEKDLQDLQQSSRNVLIFNYVSSCSSCKVFLPVFEKVAVESERLGLNVTFAKVDVMQIYKNVNQIQIKSFPTLKFYKYGKYLTTYSGEKNYEELIQFVRETSFPLKEIVTFEMFNQTQQQESIFSVFMGNKSSLDFQEYEFSSSTYGDMGHYFINTQNNDQQKLKDEIFKQYQLNNSGSGSFILLVNAQSIQKYFLFQTFEVKKIEDFYNKYAYSQLDILNSRNLNKLLVKNQDGIIFLCEQSPKCIEIQNSVIPIVHHNQNFTLPIFFGIKQQLDQTIQKKLQNLFTYRVLNQNGPQFYLIRNNGKKIYQMDIPTSRKLTIQDVENFTKQALNGNLPKLVESEPIPQNNTSPIYTVVGKTFEKEVYLSNYDVLVYFKSDFSKEHQQFIKELSELIKQIEKNGVSQFVKVVQIDMTKNKVYSESQEFLEDLEHVPKLYYFINDNDKENGIKLIQKDSNSLLSAIKKICSFDWSTRTKKTDKQLYENRSKISSDLPQNKKQNSKENKMKDEL